MQLTEQQRRERLERLRPTNTPTLLMGPKEWTWTDNDIARLRAAFQVRFNEDIPRTETLMAVASEGIRIAIEKQAEAAE